MTSCVRFAINSQLPHSMSLLHTSYATMTGLSRSQDHDAYHYRHLGFICGRNERSMVARINPFDGPLGRRLYHALLGEVLKCHCGLPFASVQHLAVHYRTCTVDLATAATTGASLKACYMHSFGINYKFHDMSAFLDKATWMVQDVSSTPSFSKLAIDEDIAYCRKLKIAPSIVLVRDSGYGMVSWTPNKQKGVDHWTRLHRQVFNFRSEDIIMTVQWIRHVRTSLYANKSLSIATSQLLYTSVIGCRHINEHANH
jgi:hypothetical protein